MILVDTSILIDYFRGIENKHTRKFQDLIDHNIPFGINYFIYQELLQGTKTIQDYKKLKKYLDTQIFYNLKGLESYAEAALIYFKCRKKGITVKSTIDVLIVQTAIENDLLLFHNDKDFENIAKVVKIKFY